MTTSTFCLTPANTTSKFNTSTLGKGLLNNTNTNTNTTLQSAQSPQVTDPPNLLRRFHADPAKRFGISDLTSVGGDLTSEAGHATSSVASAVETKASSAESKATSIATEAASAVSSVAAAATSSLAHLVDEARDELEEIEDDLADELYAKLGIQQWYAVHLTNLCYGNFTPSATAANATWGARNCTTTFDYTAGVANLTHMLNQSLAVGPFQLDLADIGLVQDVMDGINTALSMLDGCVKAIFVMYFLAAVSVGACMVLSFGAVFALADDGYASVINRRAKRVFFHGAFWSAVVGFVTLLIGNLVTTLGGKKVVEEVRLHGAQFGLNAYRGGKFMAMTWAAFALVCLVMLYWGFEEWVDFRNRRRYAPRRSVYDEKPRGL